MSQAAQDLREIASTLNDMIHVYCFEYSEEEYTKLIEVKNYILSEASKMVEE